MKLLREKYKTYDGAIKRARFENGVARSEFNHGYKARIYYYRVVDDGIGCYRVERTISASDMGNRDKREGRS